MFRWFCDPVSQFFVFHALHVHSSSMLMLKINEIPKLLIPNFVMMVLFIQQCLSFAILWFIWLCNIASLFLIRFIISYIVLFLFRFCHFLQRNKILVRFISERRLLQYIGLLSHIHYVPISNNHPNFSLLYYYIFH